MNKSKYFISRPLCPVCDSNESLIIFREAFRGSAIEEYLRNFYSSQGTIELEFLNEERYELAECQRCSCIFQTFVPNSELSIRLYTKWIKSDFWKPSANTDFKKTRPDLYSEVLALKTILSLPPKNTNILDFGSGWSEWSVIARDEGYNVTCCEINNEQLTHAREHQLNTVALDDITNDSYDFINTEQVFEHINYPLPTLQKLVDSLKPGGIIKISVPSGTGIKKLLKNPQWNVNKKSRKSLNPVAPLEHINCFQRESLFYLAENCNLKILSVQPTKFISWIFRQNKISIKTNPKLYLYSILFPTYRKTFGRNLYYWFRKPLNTVSKESK